MTMPDFEPRPGLQLHYELDDFTDPRYRAVSIADLFPDGYRRWLANNLTNDIEIKAPRVAAQGSTIPDVRPHEHRCVGCFGPVLHEASIRSVILACPLMPRT